MAIPRSKAIKLLAASEQRYYEASRTGVVDDHGATRLKKLITQARNARDKARDRVHDLKRGARGKTRAAAKQKTATTPENSVLKQALFDDILKRLEAALERALARAEPDKPPPRAAVTKAKKRRAVRKARPTTKKPSTAKKTTKKPSTAKKTTKKAAKTGKESGNDPTSEANITRPSKGTKKVAKPAGEKTAVKARAQIENAPKGAALVRKNLQAAQLTHVAHDRARGRRKQAKRDSRS